MKKYLILLLLCIQGVYAQVEFKAIPSKTTLGINEKLSVEFTMNDDGDNFVPPSFKGFTVEGPTQTISHPIVNKRQTYNKTYTYILTPKSRGTFTIGQANIEINNKIYKTIPFKITVTAATGGSIASGQPTRIGDGIYIVAEISNRNPYLNEPVAVSYKIYVDEDASVSNYDQMDSPQYNGFWSRNIPYAQKREDGMYKGKPHTFVTLEKVILYPQKIGQLEIEPVSVNVMVEVPTGRVDALGQDLMRIVPKVFSSEKITVNVKALPENGKPAGYKGAVGDFTFKVTPSKTTASSGESLRLDVSVSGRGNFNLFDLPKPIVPAALEMYDPQRRESVSAGTSGLQGTVTQSYTLIPQYKGKFKIRPLAFSFFDPKLGIYRTITSPEIVIDVPTGPPATAEAYADGTVTKKQDVKDKEGRANASDESGGFFKSAIFYGLAGLLLGVGIVSLFFMIKGKANKPKVVKEDKKKERHNLAKTYLAEAKTKLGDKEPFYVALEKALHNFLKAKLSIETSQMTKPNIRELLVTKGAERTTVEQYISVMDNCTFARYAPSSPVEMQRDYDSAESVINSLEKQL
jgi:hypothetical protein